MKRYGYGTEIWWHLSRTNAITSGVTSDKCRMDEVHLSINGKFHYLWRAIDQDGDVLDILAQLGRNKQAAKKSFVGF